MDDRSVPGLRAARRAVWYVAALGLAVTVIGVAVTVRTRTQAVEIRMAQLGDELVRAVDLSLDQGLERTRALAGLIQASEQVTPDEFDRFAVQIGPGRSVVMVGHAPADGGTGTARFFYSDGAGVIDSLETEVKNMAGLEEAGVVGPLSDAHPLMILVAGPVFDARHTVVTGVAYALVDVGSVVERPQLEGLDVEVRPNARFDVAQAGLGEWRANEVVDRDTWAYSISDPDALSQIRDPSVLVAVVGLLGAAIVSGGVYLQTARRETERALGELQRIAEDKDRFMAAVSHELRTPLTSVVGLAGVLSEAWRDMDHAEVQGFLEDIHHEGQELADLVEDLLTIGRDESGVLTYDLAEIDLGAEVGRVVRRVGRGSSIEIRVDLPLGTAIGDPLRFRQIVRNLLVNACRHADGIVEVAGIHRDGVVAVTIANDGPGIPTSEAPRLFRPYHAGLRSGQPGSIGLGLYVSRRLARGMGGDLQYVPSEGIVVFEVSLPDSCDVRPSDAGGAGRPEISRNADRAS